MGKVITFNECPRPQFVRTSYELLDGVWDFKFDHDNKGEELKFFEGFEKEHDILVPFVYQCKMSGIGIEKRCDNVWYSKKINVDLKEGKEYILHLEGSDYLTKCYVNGQYVGEEEGGYHRVSFNLTPYLNKGENLLVIKCEDDYSCEKPRGKQRWKDENFECWYVDTTGIYKSVWLEEVSCSRVEKVKITPSLSNKNVELIYELVNAKGRTLTSIVKFDDKEVARKEVVVENDSETVVIDLPEPLMLWDVDNPNLYDLTIKLDDVDEVESYFGVREVYAKDGKIYMNGKPLYQKLVLDQGYFIDSHLTAPSNKALYEDITKMKELGFNGCRKHEKVEDERFEYYADVLGYLMWSEMPSMYETTAKSRAAFEKEWLLTMKQQYNHPCIIVWTVFNESWGIRDILTNKVTQSFVNMMYYLTKEYDKTRFVISNDGWEHTVSDILTIHHYEQDGNKLHSYFHNVEKALQSVWDGHHKGAMAEGWKYQGQPIMFTEFGGTAHAKRTEGTANWGYGVGVKDDDEYIARFRGLIQALNKLEYSCGYCYTQVSDVQQEINGVLFEDREFKVDPRIFKEIQDERND